MNKLDALELGSTTTCCRILKEEPAKRMYKSLGVDFVFTGISAFESRVRKFILHLRWRLHA